MKVRRVVRVAEVDGTSHDDSSQQQYDIKRDELLHKGEIRVIRIQAIDVLINN